MKKNVLCTLFVATLALLVGCAGTAPKAATAADVSSAKLDAIKDPWKGQPVHMVVPAIAEGPAKIIGHTLLVSTAFYPTFTSMPTFESCGQVYSDEEDTSWSCGVYEEDADNDGWLEVDFSKAVSGIFELSVKAVLRNREVAALDTVEVWPTYREHLATFSAEAKSLLHCTTADITTICTLRVERTPEGLVPAGTRDIQAERAAKAEAEAAAVKRAEEDHYEQEMGAVVIDPAPMSSLDQVSSEPVPAVAPEASVASEERPKARRRHGKRRVR